MIYLASQGTHGMFSMIEKRKETTFYCGLRKSNRIWNLQNAEKVYITPSPMGGGLHNPPNYGTVYITPWTFQNRSNYPLKAVLKNHSKSQKNHKMENPIVLDSKRVDLHSEHIIWYALVYFFCCSFRSMLFFIAVKNVLKHIILYIHSVDLLIWSPIQLNFSFYDFSVIYYDFSKLL